MPSTKTHDVVAAIREFTDRQTGEKKKVYMNVGSAFTDDQGRISIKLDAVPVSPEWNGWLSLYVPKEKGERQATARAEKPRQTPPGGGDMELDDVPFDCPHYLTIGGV